jgi:intracellular multiplication protein IcmJ
MVCVLPLTTNPEGWLYFVERKHDTKFLALAQQVWDRDQLQCQYCSVPLKMGQEVVNADGCYTNNALNNLRTACQFCVQCGFLESVGAGSYGGGLLIYLPELTQVHLNGLCYALFRAIQYATPEEIVAQQAYQSLSLRAQLVENHLGAGMSDPKIFGQLLVESGLHAESDTFIANLRLLPLRAAFKEQIANGIRYEALGYTV